MEDTTVNKTTTVGRKVGGASERLARKRPMSAADRLKEKWIRGSVGRRGFFKLIGVGTLGLGFGVSIFDSILWVCEVRNGCQNLFCSRKAGSWYH